MGENKIRPEQSIKLKKRIEEFIQKNPAAIKKIPSEDIRNLFEDLQIFQIELEKYNDELQKVHDQFQESEENFRALAENANDGILIAIGEGEHAFANERAAEITGYSVSELLKTTIKDLAHPDLFGMIKNRFKTILEDKPFQKQYETKIIHKNGEEIPIEVASARTSWYGQPADLVIIRDIKERKQAEMALRESEGKYRSMMEAMKDAAYLCSSEFRIEYMNPRMISRVGHDATDELCHKAIYDSDEKCSWCVFDQIQQGEHVEYEVADPKDNRYYSITNSPISHSDGSISKLTIFRDITENKATEAQLRQA